MNNTQTLASPTASSPRLVDGMARPLLRGGTLLLVEDSRLSSEAIRLMFRSAGGRLRRAETLRAARRHLSLYTPDAALVDLGLPDGSGLELIAEIDQKRPRVPLIVAMSGQAELEVAVRAAGADRFLAKPFGSVRAFRQKLIPVFFEPGLQDDPDCLTPSDAAALRDDLYFALDLLQSTRCPQDRAYALQFVKTLAAALSDRALAEAADAAAENPAARGLIALLRTRLRALPLI